MRSPKSPSTYLHFFFNLLAPALLLAAGPESAEAPKTYCNPLPIPNLQRGMRSHPGSKFGWINNRYADFREMADPTVLFHKNRWYLYPSCGQAWTSDDFVTWDFHPIEPFVPGYAPTVVEAKDGTFYMTACCGSMWRARDPLGPWEALPKVRDENGKPVGWSDPALFVDDDGSLYCYYGLGPKGISVVKMRSDDPSRFEAAPVPCFPFDPSHRWEWLGATNCNPDKSYIEGSWMIKRNGTYYLVYSCVGTEERTYAMGCYTSKSPFGPWTCQKRNPILVTSHIGNFVNGTGHGCITPGPNGTFWAFYTTLVRIDNLYERRIGMDPVGFDENGEIYVAGPTETPQQAPGLNAYPEKKNDAGWIPVTIDSLPKASSQAPGHDAQYANDNSIRTWWEAEGPAPQWLTFDLGRAYLIRSIRTVFADRGLDYEHGILPGPYQYLIEGSRDNGTTWFPLVDQTRNTTDRQIAYDVCPKPEWTSMIRITIQDAPKGVRVGVIECTAFADLPIPRLPKK
jgi:xylan 1,4-beta-xylosidase